MNAPSISTPKPVQLLPAAIVEALIRDADREVAALEHEVVSTTEVVETLEARLAALGMDEKSSTWAIANMERFLTQLKADADAEASATIEAARAEATVLVNDAKARARLAISETEPSWFVEGAEVPDTSQLFVTVKPAVPRTVIEASRVVAPTAVEVPPVVDAPPVVEEAPVVEMPQTASAAGAVSADDEVIFEELRDPMSALAMGTAADAEKGNAQPDSEFWPAEEKTRRMRLRRPTWRAAALQGAAVAFLVAAIALRIV